MRDEEAANVVDAFAPPPAAFAFAFAASRVSKLDDDDDAYIKKLLSIRLFFFFLTLYLDLGHDSSSPSSRCEKKKSEVSA